MKRGAPNIILAALTALAALLITPSIGQAELRVAIGDLAGPKVGRRQIIGFQRALKRLGGVKIQSTGDFKKQARAMRVEDLVPQDAGALTDVCQVLEVDVAIYATLVPPDGRTWYGAGPNDRVLLVSVYSGVDGRFVEEQIVQVPRGRLTAKVWRRAAEAIEPVLGPAAGPGAPPAPMDFAPIDPDPEPRVRRPRETPDDFELGSSKTPMFRLHGGLALLSRDFEYSALPESPLFAEGGIQYASAMVPGLALDVEVNPLIGLTDSFVNGFGLGLRFEKVFLSTTQTVTGPDGEQTNAELETSHSHLLFRLLYRHVFDGGAEVGGSVGIGLLSFELQDNPEYNGVDYTYVSIGAAGLIPLGTPLAALDVRLDLLPVASIGDQVEELGAAASSSGFRVYGGVTSLVGDVSLQAGLEYTGIGADVTGEGRGGRLGESANDRYIGARLMGGYRF